jgi:hypothetical protein
VIETYATDNNGSYEGADAEALQAIEPTLNGANELDAGTPTESGYTVSVKSDTGNYFWITRQDGVTTLQCGDEVGTPATDSNAGCPAGGNWGGSGDDE